MKKTIVTIVVFVGARQIFCIDTTVSEFDDFDERDQKFTVHCVFSVDQPGVFALLRYSYTVPEITVANSTLQRSDLAHLSLHSRRKHNVSIFPRTSPC